MIKALKGQLKAIQKKYSELNAMTREQWQNSEIKELRHILEMGDKNPVLYMCGSKELDSKEICQMAMRASLRSEVMNIVDQIINDQSYSRKDIVNDLLAVVNEFT